MDVNFVILVMGLKSAYRKLIVGDGCKSVAVVVCFSGGRFCALDFVVVVVNKHTSMYYYLVCLLDYFNNARQRE